MKNTLQESSEELKLDSGNEDVDDDQLSAEQVEDDYFDEEEINENYELSFGEYFVTEIERLDLKGSQMKQKWEILKLRPDKKIEGAQLAAL